MAFTRNLKRNKKLFQKNIDPDISFNADIHFQLHKTLNEPYTAFLWITYVVLNLKEFECKVTECIF